MSRLHERRLRGIDQQVGGRCSLQPCGESFVAEAAQLHAAQHADRERQSCQQQPSGPRWLNEHRRARHHRE
jgi:hypothetical protein